MSARTRSLRRITKADAFMHLMDPEKYKDVYFYHVTDRVYHPAHKYAWIFWHQMNTKPTAFDQTDFYLEVDDGDFI